MDVRELYHELILDHGVSPRNYHKIEFASHEATGYNPICGDKITLFLKVVDDTIKEVSFTGEGCAISMASASLLTETLQGKTIEEAEALFAKFKNMLTTDNPNDLDKLNALSNVKAFPARVKCATLSWHTLLSALKHDTDVATTE